MGGNKNSLRSLLNLQIRLLKICALWPSEKSSNVYLFYMFLTLILIGVFTILNVLQIAYDTREFNLFVSDGVLFFAGISIAGKAWTFLHYRPALNQLIDAFEDSSLLTKTQQDLKSLRGRNKFLRRIYLLYFLSSTISGVAAVIEPLLHFLSQKKHLNQPFFTYFFLKDSPEWLSYIIYIHQTFAIFIYVLIDVGTDGFLWVCLNTTIFEVKMLKRKLCCMHLRTIGMAGDSCYKEWKKCFQYYQKIIKIVDLVKNIFSITVFIQFGMLSLTICFSLLSFVKPEMTHFGMTALAPFLAVTTTQLLLPCWLGSTLLYESASLADAVYSCNWWSQGLKNRKFIIIFMERLKTHFILTMCKIFPLTLHTFIGIMKASYSFYTLLIYTTNKNLNT